MLGEEARQYGFKASLLERLQRHYKRIGDKASILQATLKTNFRCQEDILRFASDLFYDSSVKVSRTCSSIQPHPEFPYPLVFVCTSDKELRTYENTVNQKEADLLMNLLVDHSRHNRTRNVCVMSSSRGQVCECVLLLHFLLIKAHLLLRLQF